MDELTTGRVRAAARGFAPRLVREDDAADAGSIPSTSTDPSVQEVSDSLADLFLGVGPGGRSAEGATASSAVRSGERGQARPSRGSDSRSPRGTVPSIELLVLGHLPVLGTAWLGQYALHVAQARGGAVALVRLEPGSASIEVFGLDRGDDLARVDRLDAGVRLARARGVHWVVKVDELGEAALAESARLDAITLLTGVGEASIVAAYRALKQIVQRGSRSRPAGEDHPERPELRIALLGASPERAREAAARVRKAAGTFLGRSVGVVTCAERIGATGGRVLYRGSFEGDAALLIAEIDRPLAVETPAEPAPDATRGDPAVGGDAFEALGRGDGVAGARGARVADQVIGSSAWSDDDEAWLLDVAGGSAPSAGEPAEQRPPEPGAGAAERTETRSDSGARASGASRSGALATPEGAGGSGLAVRLGLSALPIRCPHVASVELAVDGGGGLHAIAMDEMSAREAPAGGRVGVSALLSAEAWIAANLGLIRRALPAVVGDAVELHLVTRVPAGVRDLLETRVRVHLLAGADGHEVCVGLN